MFPTRLIILLVAFMIFRCAPVAAENFKVELDNNCLSLTATEVPLRIILLELVAQGISIKIDPQITPQITAHFTNRPLQQALESIVKPASHLLIWKNNPNPSAPNSLVVSEIKIFQSNRIDRIQALVRPKSRQIVKGENGVSYVENEILLHILPETDIRDLRKLLKSYGATLVVNKSLPDVVKIVLPDGSDVFSIARELKEKLRLNLAEPNYAFPSPPPVRYSNTLPPATPKAENLIGTTASSIAILDSGLNKAAGLDQVVLSSLDAINPDAQITDTLGHGTQMAFIASGLVKPYGSAENTEKLIPIIPIKVFDDQGYTTSIDIMESINFAMANNAKVMSLSWGTEIESDFMENAFEKASSNGLIIIASAGNEPKGTPVYPAAYPFVIGVGALEPDGTKWAQSNYGDFVTLYASGFANMPVGHNGDPGLYAGTSISAALVANNAAHYLMEHPHASHQEVSSYLEDKYESNRNLQHR